MCMTRRLVLGGIAFAPLASVRAEEPDSPAQCYDSSSLPRSQRSMRRSLGFKDVADCETKSCSTCAFFTRKDGDCGTCQLLIGGPTSAASVCNSWAESS